jgi:hypothetical protein
MPTRIALFIAVRVANSIEDLLCGEEGISRLILNQPVQSWRERELFRAQRDNGVYTCGAPSWQVARQQGRDEQHPDDSDVRQWIGAGYP